METSSTTVSLLSSKIKTKASDRTIALIDSIMSMSDNIHTSVEKNHNHQVQLEEIVRAATNIKELSIALKASTSH